MTVMNFYNILENLFNYSPKKGMPAKVPVRLRRDVGLVVPEI